MHPPHVVSPRVRSVLTGRVQALGGTRSGIHKIPVAGAVEVGEQGLAGDEQGDLRIHGGIYKAVHCYAWEHYAAWREVLPGNPLWDAPGAFGENLSIEGLREQDVCIGDRWRIGTAECLISQGRQPCFKLNLRFGVRDMSARVQDSLMAGWYLQVVRPGVVRAGDALELLDRPHPEYSIALLLALIRDRVTDEAVLRGVLDLPLPPSWRKLFEARMKTAQVEDWGRRMQGGSA